MKIGTSPLSITMYPLPSAHDPHLVETTIDPAAVSMIAGPYAPPVADHPRNADGYRGVFIILVDRLQLTAVMTLAQAAEISANIDARAAAR